MLDGDSAVGSKINRVLKSGKDIEGKVIRILPGKIDLMIAYRVVGSRLYGNKMGNKGVRCLDWEKFHLNGLCSGMENGFLGSLFVS
jgi:hypothetical protein